MKKFFRIIGGRIFLASFFIILQVLFIFIMMNRLARCSSCLSIIMTVISIFIIIYLVNKNANPMYTFAWSTVILLFPPAGWMLYLLIQHKNSGNIRYDSKKGKISVHKEFDNKTIAFIENISDYNLCTDSDTRYYACGEQFYTDYINELKTAECYVYIEYFIINKGVFWNTVLEILKELTGKNVDVRIIYDDMCSPAFTEKYCAELMEYGIRCAGFNTVKPFPGTFLNSRDHRKITVIDGKTAFTGGINISDEYINLKERFGYWKDCALKITGSAAESEAESFCKMWFSCTGEETDLHHKSKNTFTSNEIIIPFDVYPNSTERSAELIYMKIINSAEKYINITTPYLIPDSDMLTALKLSAMSGTEVKIITPHIPDKKYIFAVTRSYYKELIDSGVKIYEYKPGFIHSKIIISDDISAVVGTANFDYRSFYLLYENGVFIHDSDAIADMKNDFDKTLNNSIEITAKRIIEMPKIYRFFGAILKIFSPLM